MRRTIISLALSLMRDSQINKNRYDMRRVKSLFGGLAFWPRAANDSHTACMERGCGGGGGVQKWHKLKMKSSQGISLAPLSLEYYYYIH
jgi:hypothetical protein